MRAIMQGKLSRITNGVTAFVLAVSLITPLAYTQNAYADGEGFYTVEDKTMVRNTTLAITDLQIAGGNGSDVLDLTIKASGGTIDFDTVEAPEITGRGTDYIMMSGTSPQINATLSTMQYQDDGVGEATITAELGNNVGNVIWNDGEGGNGHAYIVINQNMTWAQARAQAETYTFGGQQGYLATITDEVENDFVYDAIDEQTGWIGATDLENGEGQWYWRTGPEAGTQFWSGDFNGSAVDDAYANWDDGEPNNSSLNEHCGQFWNDGNWNDIACSTLRPFVVEFGSDGNLPQPVRREFTIAVTGATQNIANCDELMALTENNIYDTINLTSDINCADTNVAPMFEGEGFEGVFDGNGHTISNFTYETSDRWYIGLVNQAFNATFRNINLDNFDITALGYIGTLTSVADNTTISNVHVTNTHLTPTRENNDNGRVGGLVGLMSGNSRIEDSSVVGGLISTNGYGSIGGLVGQVYNSVIERSFSDIDINSTYDDENGWSQIGGLIGSAGAFRNSGDDPATEMIVRDAYSWSNIDAPQGKNIGGLIGDASVSDGTQAGTAKVTVTRTYASGSVNASDSVGGLIGTLYSDYYYDGVSGYTITNNFAMGEITSDGEYAGSLVGRNQTTNAMVVSSNNFYDQARTGQSVCSTEFEDIWDEIYGEPLQGCTAVNASGNQPNYFINNSTNAPLNTWNFAGVWTKNATVPPTFAVVTDDNGDGTPDSEQTNVASFTSPVNGKKMVVQLSDICSITQASASVESDVVKDVGYVYTGGLVSFDADCTSESTEVVLYAYGMSADGVLARKFNPAGNGTYFTIDGATISTVTINGQQVVKATYTITDNGELDLNKEDGKISDPVGLGTAVGAPNTGLGGKH